MDVDRVRRVLEKTARGLWTFETSAPRTEGDAAVFFCPVHTLNEDARDRFFSVGGGDLVPEVGSRLMFRILEDWDGTNRWQVVQKDRFDYAIETGTGGERVKLLLRGYLAAEVTFAGDW